MYIIMLLVIWRPRPTVTKLVRTTWYLCIINYGYLRKNKCIRLLIDLQETAEQICSKLGAYIPLFSRAKSGCTVRRAIVISYIIIYNTFDHAFLNTYFTIKHNIGSIWYIVYSLRWVFFRFIDCIDFTN